MPHNYAIALLITFLAGLATAIGSVVAFILKRDNLKALSVGLGFSAGVMIFLSFTDIIPSAGEMLKENFPNNHEWIVYGGFIIGILIAILIDMFIPDHIPEQDLLNPDKVVDAEHRIKRAGLLTAVAICVHNFPEGMATFISSYEDPSLGLYITLAIMLHNIPEGISIAIPIYSSTNSKLKAFKYTFLSALAEPLGAIITFLFLQPFINELLLGIVFAIVCGVMIYIAFNELIPNAINLGFQNIYLFSILLGIIVMSLSHIFLH